MSVVADRVGPLSGVCLDVPPSVYEPRRDTALLAETAMRYPLDGRAALDLCTGSGAVALVLARLGASVTAVDIDERAVAAARANAARNSLVIDARIGDLFGPVRGCRFDLITCNPPYLPSPPGLQCARWDAGRDGRAVIDRVVDAVSSYLSRTGVFVLVQSGLAGIDDTARSLRHQGFDARVVAEHTGPLGPVASERRLYLEARGGGGVERLVVIEAARHGRSHAPARAD